jgi:hypothetical protein
MSASLRAVYQCLLALGSASGYIKAIRTVARDARRHGLDWKRLMQNAVKVLALELL